ncbi:MAG: endonuclease/exonuclease/phosphatase family protein [Clostridia bacterium]
MLKLKVMTYNIMSGKSYQGILDGKAWNDPSLIDPSLAAAVIAGQAPDIVGLNEVHGKGGMYGEQAEQIAGLCGYPYYYFAQAIMDNDSPYGNAVLSKYPIVSAETVKIPDSGEIVEGVAESRCVARLTLDAQGRKIDVLSSHFGLLDSERMEAVKTVQGLVRKAENPCIVMGDFNCEPDSVPIRGLREVLQDTAPEQLDETWETFIGQSVFKKNEDIFKIDYIFADRRFTVCNARILTETASDHRPYLAELSL